MESPINNPERDKKKELLETGSPHPDQAVTHNIQSVRNKLSELFKNGEAVVFAGAGISLEPPAGLPDWHKLRDFTLEAIASRDEFLSQFLDILTSTPMIAAPGKRGLTPEVVASEILGNCKGYFECFRSLEEGEPNTNHRYLAKLTKNRHLQYIFTTNFDLFIEKALEDEGVEFIVHRTEEEFQNFQQDSDIDVVHIFKLHGCISEPSTITTTVEQEGRGLPAAKRVTLDTLLPTHNFVFWGYSGADLKIDIDYLRMETNQDTAKGFVWNFLQRDDYTEPVNPYVEQLRGMYGDRSQVVHGKLPEVFDEFIEPEERIERTEYTKQQEQEWMEDKNEKLRGSLREWAAEYLWQGNACNIFGGLLKYSGYMDKALKCFERLAGISRKDDNKQHLATALNSIGIIHRARDDYDQALEYFKQVEEIFRNLSDQERLATALNNIGMIYSDRDDYDQALEYFKQAEEIFRNLSDQERLATALNNIGTVYRDGKDYDQALEYFKQAEEITRAFGKKIGLAIDLNNIGTVYQDREDYDQALEYFKQAEEIFRNLSARERLITTLSNIGTLYELKEDYDQALEYFKQAEEITRAFGNKKDLAIILNSIGMIYNNREDYDQALEYFKQAEEIARAFGNKKDLAIILNSIGAAYQDREDYDQAIEYYKQTFQVETEIDIPAAILTINLIATIYNKLKKYKEAIKYYEISIAYCRNIGDNNGVSELRIWLKDCKNKLALNSSKSKVEKRKKKNKRKPKKH